MSVVRNTYQQFLKKISGSPSLGGSVNINQIISRFQDNTQPASNFSPVAFLLDYTNQDYVFVDETLFDLLGYRASEFLQDGLKGTIDKYHPDDFRVMNEHVFPANLAFLEKHASSTFDQFIFSHNYRLRNTRGGYTNILQRYSLIPHPDTGKPCAIIGVVFDITHFKNDLSMVHTIERVEYIDGQKSTTLLSKKIYPVFESSLPVLFSSREMEILQLIREGQSSKQIASRLGLSINTVSNHRKKILQKAQCSNTGELVHFATAHGLFT